MRTKLLAAAAILAAGVASSMAQSNVYSLNVVGYVNVAIPGGGATYTAVANPLKSTNDTFAGVLSSVPPGSTVLKWNPGIADYDPFLRTGFGAGWSPASGATTTLNPGEAVLILNGGSDITNTFVGEVMQGDLTNSFAGGLKMVGNMVPETGLASAIQLVPPTGSTLLKWNIGIQDFDPFLKTGFGIGWSPGVPTINVAEGFFIDANGPFDWVRNFTVP